MAADSSGSCPDCGSSDIELDAVQALTFCLACGYVLDNVQLVQRETWTDNVADGVRVGENDDGRLAGAFGLQSSGTSHGWMKQNRAKAQAKLRGLCGVMGMTPQVQSEASAILEQLIPHLHGSGKVPSERLAAVALYIAARLAQLPLTIVDMSSAVKTSVPTFGRAFKLAVRTLDIHLPPTPPGAFIRAAGQTACPDPQQRAAVGDEAEALHAWLLQSQTHGTPLLRCACALAITLESRGIKTKAVSRALHVSEVHLRNCVRQAKDTLFAAATALPWAGSITLRNVSLHQAAIVRLVPAIEAAQQLGPCPRDRPVTKPHRQ